MNDPQDIKKFESISDKYKGKDGKIEMHNIRFNNNAIDTMNKILTTNIATKILTKKTDVTKSRKGSLDHAIFNHIDNEEKKPKKKKVKNRVRRRVKKAPTKEAVQKSKGVKEPVHVKNLQNLFKDPKEAAKTMRKNMESSGRTQQTKGKSSAPSASPKGKPQTKNKGHRISLQNHKFFKHA